jgi:hypothetical protein
MSHFVKGFIPGLEEEEKEAKHRKKMEEQRNNAMASVFGMGLIPKTSFGVNFESIFGINLNEMESPEKRSATRVEPWLTFFRL